MVIRSCSLMFVLVLVIVGNGASAGFAEELDPKWVVGKWVTSGGSGRFVGHAGVHDADRAEIEFLSNGRYTAERRVSTFGLLVVEGTWKVSGDELLASGTFRNGPHQLRGSGSTASYRRSGESLEGTSSLQYNGAKSRQLLERMK